MKIACFVPLVSLLLTVIPGCKKDSTDEPSARVNNAPLVNAGNDTTLYFPVSTIELNGIASDLDYDGIEYDWQLLSGPSEVLMNPAGGSYTMAFGLNAPGVYEFQLNVKDIRAARGHDRIKVIVAERPCSSPMSEQILTDQEWVADDWGSEGIPIDLFSHISLKGNFKQLFIKLDSATRWIPVPAFDYGLPRPSPYYYQYINGVANIFPNDDAEISESPDIKIVYCN